MLQSSLLPPVLLIGGTGFVGRALAARLCSEGYSVTIPTRDRERARGQLLVLRRLTLLTADVHDPVVLTRLVGEAGVVINLVGILQGTPRQFELAHVELTRQIIAACQAQGVRRYLHMSALGADAVGPSIYQRTKGAAEALVRASALDWTILRPSVIFGEQDRFLNLFARLQRYAPVVPLAGASARFQPVWVQDVVRVFAAALARRDWIGQSFDLVGPKVYTLAELVHYAGHISGYSRLILPLPDWLAQWQAAAMSMLPHPPLTRDNLDSMRVDNVSDQPFPDIPGFQPAALENIAPSWLAPDAQGDRYASLRSKGRDRPR